MSTDDYARLARIVTFRPLSSWPGPRTKNPKRSPFEAAFASTVGTLVRELKALDAKQVVMELDLREQDLRLDGMPRANARLASDGVVLSMQTRHGPLRYACDSFRAPRYGSTGWQHNVRAIALGLEALRKVDRYGITQRGEQYRGFLALEAPTSSESTHLTHDQAVVVLRRWARRNEAELPDLERVIRLAKINAHPDRQGGDHGPWNEVDAAAKVVQR